MDRSPQNGFTLIELLLVLTIIGLMMVLILPRAMRANTESKFSLIRQYSSEIAEKIMSYAEIQARSQRPGATFTIKDFLFEDILPEDGAGFVSRRLVGKYTGSDDFDGVENLISSDFKPRNPFNEANYFSKVNDDQAVPSKKPGLLFFAAQKDPAAPEFLNFYLVITDSRKTGNGNFWYGGMDPSDPDKIRKGIFVARLYDDFESGRLEPKPVTGPVSPLK